MLTLVRVLVLVLVLAPVVRASTPPDSAALVVVVANGALGAEETAAPLREALATAHQRATEAGIPLAEATVPDLEPTALPPEAGQRVAAALAALAEAETLLYALEVERAQARYAAGFAILDRDPTWLAAVPDAASRVFDHALRRAHLLTQLGERAQAGAVLQRLAFDEREQSEPDPERHPESTIADYHRARAEVWRETGDLEVALPGDECALFVQGRPVGKGPAVKLRRPTGPQRLVARCGAHWSSPQEIALHARGARLAFDPPLDHAPRGILKGALTVQAPADGPLAPERVAQWAARRAGHARILVVEAGAEAARLFLLEEGAIRHSETLLPPPVVAPAPRRRLWTWVSLGSGLALAGAGAYFHWATVDATRDVNAGWQALERREQSLALMGTFYGLGGAALVGSLVLFFLEADAASDKPLVVGPMGPNLLGLSGSF